MNVKKILPLIFLLMIAIQIPFEKSFGAPEKSEKIDISKHIYILLDVPKSTAFVNELIPFSAKLYSDWIDLENIELSQGLSENLIIKKLQKKEVNIIERDGARYVTLEYGSSFFAVMPGTYELEPVKAEFDVVKAGNKTIFGEEKLLNNNQFLYDEYISNSEKRRIEVESPPFNIVIRPLPPAGQPSGFKGSVGNFTFNLDVQPTNIKKGGLITIKMTISGNGNYDSVTSPEIGKIEGIKSYEPKIAKTEGSVTYEENVRIESSDVREVPAIEFVFFDPDKQEYVSMRKGPIPITIEGISEGNRYEKISEEKKSAENKEPWVVQLKDRPGTIYRHAMPFIYRNRILLISIMTFPLLLIVLSTIIQKRIRFLEDNPQYVALLSASKKARRAIDRAEDLLKKRHAKEFYDAIFRAMQYYLGERALLPSDGVTEKAIDEISGLNINNDILNKIKNIFSECYLAKYTAADLDESGMIDTLGNMKYVINELDKKNFIK